MTVSDPVVVDHSIHSNAATLGADQFYVRDAKIKRNMSSLLNSILGSVERYNKPSTTKDEEKQESTSEDEPSDSSESSDSSSSEEEEAPVVDVNAAWEKLEEENGKLLRKLDLKFSLKPDEDDEGEESSDAGILRKDSKPTDPHEEKAKDEGGALFIHGDRLKQMLALEKKREGGQEEPEKEVINEEKDSEEMEVEKPTIEQEKGEIDEEDDNEERDQKEKEEEEPTIEEFSLAADLRAEQLEKDYQKMQNEEEEGDQVEDNYDLGEAQNLTNKEIVRIQSRFEQEQERISERIANLEERNLEGRSWQLMGETMAKDRPKDALLEEDLEFTAHGKMKPQITEELSQNLEDMIKLRIRNEDWNDVEKKFEEPKDKAKRKLVQVSAEKSKYGLAELYEREYIEKTRVEQGGMTYEEEAWTKQQEVINKLKAKIFFELDALCNFQAAPRFRYEDVTIRPNVSAVAMEEAVPIAVATETLQAPEEVYRPPKAVKGENELTREERKARRRRKKQKFKKRKLAEGEQKGDGKKAKFIPLPEMTRVSQAVTLEGGIPFSSSKAMFAELEKMKTQPEGSEILVNKKKTTHQEFKL